jgi:hypothetical protein
MLDSVCSGPLVTGTSTVQVRYHIFRVRCKYLVTEFKYYLISGTKMYLDKFACWMVVVGLNSVSFSYIFYDLS